MGVKANNSYRKAYSNNESPKYAADDDCWLEEIGPVELGEYREMLMNLGFYPDKVLINTLTMIAEDYAPLERSASELYNLIREMLLNPKVAAGRKLPLIYVIDSILKNAKGQYVPIIESTASEWIYVICKVMKRKEEERNKLRKVLYSWRDADIFQPVTMGLLIDAFEAADTPVKANENSHHHIFSTEITMKKRTASKIAQKEGKRSYRVESNKDTEMNASLRRCMTFQEMRRYPGVNTHFMKLTDPSTFSTFSIPDKQTSSMKYGQSRSFGEKSLKHRDEVR
jgi:hypothetical protein